MADITASVRAALGTAIPGLNVRTGEIGALIKRAVRDGWSQSQLLLGIYASRTFKARFPAIRNADGSLRMSPAAYLQREQDLRATMQSFGLLSMHYNKPNDFAGMIARGVDAQQLQQRLAFSQDLLRSNPQVVKQLQGMYGISAKAARNGALAWLLDTKKGTEVLQKEVTSAQIAVSARQAGFDVHGMGKGFFEGLAGEGVSGAQANQAFQQAGLDRAQLRTFAARYHYGELSDKQVAAALFHPDPEVAATRASLFAQEAAQFRAGVGYATGQEPGIAGLQTTAAADQAYA